MKIDKPARAAARHKKTEAVDSYVATQKYDPVHSHSDGIKTVSRSGVVARNDKNVGHEAMQRAREAIERVESVTFTDSRAKTGTNDEWFKTNQESVEQQIMQRIELSKRTNATQVTVFIPNDSDQSPVFYYGQGEAMPIEHYRPVVDDDAEIYIPKSER
jgi:hypothetical protein